MSFVNNLLLAISLYWKTVFIIVYPLALLPIFSIDHEVSTKCAYVIVLMAGYWITEALPIPITSAIPVAFFPLMGILDSSATAECYASEATMLFIGGYMLALAVEASDLQLRISLHVIKLIGFSPRKLHISFSCITMFISMWISNTATTALMIPIVYTTLKELEANGVGKMYEGEGALARDEESPEEEKRRPTRSTMAYFISIAYASTIGGTGFITGNASNLEFKGIYETTYPNLKISSTHWLIVCLPYMIITMAFTIFWVQIMYMGLFRPSSSAAQELKAGTEEKEMVKAYITEKLNSMGLISFHEIAVAVCFFGAILLWVFRQPHFMPGWADLWVEYNTTIKDASAAMAIVIVIFLVPRKPGCVYAFSSNEDKKPLGHSNGLLTWKYSLKKLPWGLFFLIGAGFAIAEGAHKSGLSERLTKEMEALVKFSSFGILAIMALIATFMTQLTTNVGVCSILMPVLATVAKAADVHPIYIMFPANIACSFAYLLPVSTPPNALIADYIHMPTLQMMKIGIIVVVTSYLVMLGIFAGLLPILYKVNKFPLQAYMPLDAGVAKP
ncbi:hypothetical protein HHI36_005904 [Cryptolaemus montrouzieri]|uniref:Protein I'm not dead yet n=1 Tax=Cryptolaemus montrouzieri TaxID=559131 RepID=A0ABD2NVR1_9CUCU